MRVFGWIGAPACGAPLLDLSVGVPTAQSYHLRSTRFQGVWLFPTQQYRKDMLQRYDFSDKNEIDHDWAKAYPEQALNHFGKDKLEDSRI